MRVLVVTVVHVPLDARIHHRQVRALRQADVEVSLAAPFTATGTDPGAALAGVHTIDLPRATGRQRLVALRAARTLITRLAPAHDLVLLHDPELVLAVAGRLRRLPPVVLDVHEDLVAALVDDRPWVPGPLRPGARWLARRLEAWSERHLAGLLLAETAYRSRFAGAHPVVPNLPWLPADPPPCGQQPRVVYVGRISVGRGAHELIALGAALRDTPIPVSGMGGTAGAANGGGTAGGAGGETGGETLHLEIVGRPDADVRDAVVAAHDAGALTWHGELPNDRAMQVVAGSVAGLSLLHDRANYRASMPTKVVEYLAQGVPVVTTPLPEAARIVTAAAGGLVVPFADVEAAVAALRDLAGDPELRARAGAAGREHVRAHASWDAQAPRFVAHLASVAGIAPGGVR